jgi:hypothetical protein
VKDPHDPDDPYLGRILSMRIPPPHSVASVKRHLSKRENIPEGRPTNLCENLSSRAPLKNTEHVDIIDPVGAGSTPGDPVALVILNSSNEQSETRGRTQSILEAHSSPDWSSHVNGIPRPWTYIYTLQTIDGTGNLIDVNYFLIFIPQVRSPQ